jgi:hypothetical protein
MNSSSQLTDQDIYIIVEKFIGAPNGDLEGFSYRTLNGFLRFQIGIPEAGNLI